MSASDPPVAAIDCGTNSIRLLIARPSGEQQLVDLDRRMLTVRLGEGVDATGRLSDAALPLLGLAFSHMCDGSTREAQDGSARGSLTVA